MLKYLIYFISYETLLKLFLCAVLHFQLISMFLRSYHRKGNSNSINMLKCISKHNQLLSYFIIAYSVI